MTIQKEIELLNDEIVELMYLVKTQLEKDRQAFLELDEELAHEIIANEKRVDKLELKIDRDCENFLALHNPVAVDLRFIISCFKINSELERIGDHADSIAKYILDFKGPINKAVIEEMQLEEMFNVAIEMVNYVFESFTSEDTTLARKVFAKDEILNRINRQISDITAEVAEKYPNDLQQYLYLFSIIRKLERVGDLTKNIAEEIIFYIEAKILKHKKKQENNKNKAG